MTTRIRRLTVRTAIMKSMNRAIAKLPALAKPSPDERALEAALAKELEPLRATTRFGATLLADINPTMRRLVYADLLLEQGDPRGEFITIQIERARKDPDPEAGERDLELLEKDGKAWLGARHVGQGLRRDNLPPRLRGDCRHPAGQQEAPPDLGRSRVGPGPNECTR